MTDVDGVALPGVTITLASPALIGDTRTAVTGADGRYRFPATPLGSYSVEASLNGFISQALGGIRVSIGSRMAANFQMRLGVQETVTVMGEAPLIDVKGSSAVQTTMAADYFQGLPSARTNAGATDLLGMAPGATVGSSDRAGGVTGRGGSQFGGTKNGAQFSFDGVNVNSSEGGEVELQMDFDNVAEVNFGGIGAPAEVGGYNGLVMNLVTKSGSNELHGQGNIFFRLDSFTTQNSDDPEFRRDLDNEHQWHLDVGGPLAKDKLWGYGSFRRSVRNFATELSGGTKGFAHRNQLLAKLTWQASTTDRVTGQISWEKEDALDPADAFITPEATLAPYGLWRIFMLDYLKVFSDTTLVEVHSAFVDADRADGPGAKDIHPDTDPSNLLPAGHFDLVTGVLSESPGFFFDRTRNRYQVNVALSHYADEFLNGSHDFKTGVQVDVSPTRTFTGYIMGAYYVDYGGEPLYRYETPAQDDQPENRQVSGFLQNAWTFAGNRVTINPGVRINWWQGCGQSVQDAVTGFPALTVDHGCLFEPKMGLAPRFGLTYDITGDGTTAFKVHYGKYYSQLITSMYLAPDERLFQFSEWNPDIGDFEIVETEFRLPGDPIDPDIEMPYFREFSVAVEHQVADDVSVELTGIVRRNEGFLDKILTNGVFGRVEATDPVTGTTYNFFDQLNANESEILITTPSNLNLGFPFDTFEQSRKYWGVGLTVEKRFSNNWQLTGSYFYSKTEGTDDTAFENGRGSALGPSNLWTNPNQHINAFGPLEDDHPHNIKVIGSFRLPLDIDAGFFYWFQSGQVYTREVNFRGVRSNDRSITVFGEPRGSRRLPNQSNVDLRAEKIFRVNDFSIAAGIDVFNLFNAASPSRSYLSSHL